MLYKIHIQDVKFLCSPRVHEADETNQRVNTVYEIGLVVDSEMSEKDIVSLKNRERVSGSTFWRHSWHCSAYLPRESSFTRLANPVRSWENMARAKIDK